jgi:hypothetical protein
MAALRCTAWRRPYWSQLKRATHGVTRSVNFPWFLLVPNNETCFLVWSFRGYRGTPWGLSIVCLVAWRPVVVHCHLLPRSPQGGLRCNPALFGWPRGWGVAWAGGPLVARTRSRRQCMWGWCECRLVLCIGTHLERTAFPVQDCRGSSRSLPPELGSHWLSRSCNAHNSMSISERLLFFPSAIYRHEDWHIQDQSLASRFAWGTPLWSSGQSSCLQIQRSGFDSRHYQISWEVAGLERGPLSLMTTIEELTEWYV